MYTKTRLIQKYINYWFHASNGKGHGVHSPFVFDFITTVLNDRVAYSDYSRIEAMRERLLNDQRILTLEDLGAGSARGVSNRRSVASIARHAAKPRKFGQLLYRMAKKYQPKTVLELGTSLGITSSYLAAANLASNVITIEGAQQVYEIANANFRDAGLHNISSFVGNFDTVLPLVLTDTPTIDFAFIDGNHRFQPTVQYFDSILSQTTNLSIIVMDDIHWSREMEQAWAYCREHMAVTLSIDLFFIGILVFSTSIKEKQHFSIRF